MIERGNLVEEITSVLGPVKRRVVREEWRNHNEVVTAIVPRFSHFTLTGECGRRVLHPLDPLVGRVERVCAGSSGGEKP